MSPHYIARKAIGGAAAFMVIQAVLAAVWRRALWPDTYEGRGFYDFDEPTVALVLGGLASYFLTGLVVSMLYGHFTAATGGQISTARFLLITGVLYWVLHDFSYIGRQEMDGPALYLLLEGALALGIFGAFSVVLPRLFRSAGASDADRMHAAVPA
ncbi:MAG: hypothetical protein AAF567_06235 [Actinomycetota bacterium]